MEMRISAALLLSLVFAFLSALTVPSTALGFNCSSAAATTCNALIDYVSPNDTTLANISSLFGVTNFYSLLGANSFDPSTLSDKSVAANETIKIPFPCGCSNGTGISDQIPVYVVKSGDDLDHIATDVFSGLVTYQEIAQVNNISDPSKIQVAQKLWIPLPCSCDKVGGDHVVHYGHVVAKGSSVKQIAVEYGTEENTLLELNGMSNANELQAGQVLDVPLQVCSSSLISRVSEDYPLLVPNGTYALTAYNCIKCECQSSNNSYFVQDQTSTNLSLHCEPSQGVKPSNISQCPSMQCGVSGGLLIGNTDTSSCTSCYYSGYNTTIFTSLGLGLNDTCKGNHAAARIGSQGSSWRFLLVSIHLGLLCLGLLP